ncbi:ABC transporter permease [Paenibacillus donghaensis]|uniref:ABC transporter permease n=1 Tax=Paenibacillus donghaensis TaxID=414771 RepID=A0A2Z2KGH6_9BACL|nr:DUF2705 family protein [Paenibacillus donghaensis]ASA21259.1 hypothetical protein B9T62_10960 [Paenibacillus donghaensis]
MRNFSRLITNEWIKLFKKTTFAVPFVLMFVVTMVVGYVMRTYNPEVADSVTDFTASIIAREGLGQIVAILAIIGTAGVVSKEHSQGTIKFLLIRARSRSEILASKYAAVLIYGLTLVAFTLGSALVAGTVWFGVSGGDTTFSDILLSSLYLYVYTVVYMTLGFMVGILTKSTGATIGIALFATTIDRIIISKAFYKYFLFPNLDLGAYENGAAPMPGMTYTFSVIMLTAYLLLFLLIGFSVFRRRDVA